MDDVKLAATVQRSSTATLLRQVQQTISRHGMLVAGDRVLVAVSGGPDSVALVAALARLQDAYGIELRVAHLNHQLRGAESRRDQECAETVARRLGLACVVGGSATLADGPNLEARARTERYRFLHTVAEAQGCNKIATGHTRDDQAETVLMRVLRGTGGDGLAGIRAVRDGRIIRPLIECGRSQVLTFLRDGDLPYCEDSSNQDRRFLRNRVRHEVMPLLRSINPNVQRRLVSIAEIATVETQWLDDHVRSLLAAAQLADGALAVSTVAAAPAALRARLVRAWLRERRGDLHRLAAAHVHAIVQLAEGERPNGDVRLPGGELVVRAYEQMTWCRQETRFAIEPERVLIPGTAVCFESGWRIRAQVVTKEQGWQPPADLWDLIADAEAITAPLVVRTACPGDRVRPLGLDGHRKLQDIFVDRKLPRRSRRSCPVVTCNGEILWVPGVVRGSAALVTADTSCVLRLEAEKTGIAGT
ncbi:MAG TPA: tRNA lysidine(34) synthetase TilS [Candidatus Acidoferrales bacterium]|nr:tRNA lysidine(34) synthetase TilS [Candidatus Acidoferrales bacterium]